MIKRVNFRELLKDGLVRHRRCWNRAEQCSQASLLGRPPVTPERERVQFPDAHGRNRGQIWCSGGRELLLDISCLWRTSHVADQDSRVQDVVCHTHGRLAPESFQNFLNGFIPRPLPPNVFEPIFLSGRLKRLTSRGRLRLDLWRLCEDFLALFFELDKLSLQ